MSTTAEPILRSQSEGVALLTLNRPETHNALSGEEMFAAFETLFAQIDRDPDVRAVVLTGSGSSFCSGGNVAEMRDRSGMFAGNPEEIAQGYRNGIQRIPRAFSALQVPIIAAVNGPAIGAGFDLASMCDIRIASERARFAESFVKLGIIPGDGGCWLLPRMVGPSRAAELIFTGDAIDAQEALRIGYLSKVSGPEQLLDDAMALARRIAANPSQALRWSKRLLRAGAHQTLDQALEQAAQLQGMAHQTEEHAAAVAKFFERKAKLK